MRTATLRFVVLALSAASLAYGACDSRSTVTPPEPDAEIVLPDANVRIDAATVTPDAATPTPDAASSRVCIARCTADIQCSSTCPTNPIPTNAVCCDLSTNMCFNSSSATCPSTTPVDSGTSSY